MNDERSISNGGLVESLSLDQIEIRFRAGSWEDAVNEAGILMLDTGLIKPSYIEAMKDALRTLGPYCVIAPGIAMPHARPEDGVLKGGFSLLILESPVEFGHEANDPVDIVIGFAAKDKTEHVLSLKEIALYFGDQDTVQEIRKSNSKEQIIHVLSTKRK
jgi:mannitol/fructose-specific phosphotransferase system IIA component (Ntr-type)